MRLNDTICAVVALSLGLGLIVGAAFAADTPKYTETFESYNIGTSITSPVMRHVDLNQGDYGWFTGSEEDASEVIAANGGKALRLDTASGVITNKLESGVASDLNNALSSEGSIYYESEVKFVYSDTLDPGVRAGEDNTKFALYAYCPGDMGATTNLVIFHKYIDFVDGKPAMAYTNEITSVKIDTGVYTKLRVEMKKVGYEGSRINVFSVRAGDGAEPVSSLLAYDADFSQQKPGRWFLTLEEGGSGEVSRINLEGSGEIDNIVLGVIGGDEPQSGYRFPDGTSIPSGSALDAWLVSINATQAQIDALLFNAILRRNYLLNLALDPSSEYALTVSSIAVGDTVDVAVTLTRTGAIGKINGTLALYGAASLDGEVGFEKISGAIFQNGDFADDATPATASFAAGAAKFFKAVVE